jgi:tetratricopeptide (TPR) repeat protein
MKHLGTGLLLALLSFRPVVLGQSDAHHQHADTLRAEQYGTVFFPISCSSQAQKTFERGVAMLHSFEYEDANATFIAVAHRGPNCAMAYWGQAVSYYHPHWQTPDASHLKLGREASERALAIGGKTPREKEYITAIADYYRDSERLDSRTRAVNYQKALEHLYTAYPDDREAALFYALQIIANAPPRDSSYAEQKKAGAILEKIFAESPNHPGVAHYIIHAYDNPVLANRALAAARSYAKIAPSSVHALHMPSHIFIQVGLWQEAIDSNRASLAAARAWVAKSGRKELWDQQAHAQDYLAYAYLQTGQDLLARQIRDEVSRYSERFGETPMAAYSALVGIPARYALERHQWAEAAALPIRKVPMPLYEAETYFARAIGCARTGDLAGAKSNADKLAELRGQLPQGNQGWVGNADLVEVQRLQAEAWLAHAEKRDADAVRLMKSAIALEESTSATWIAAPLLAGNEQLGDLLLEQNQPEQALAAYEASLQLAPNRFNSLFGAGRAAELAGTPSKAETYYAQLLSMCKDAESERPELHFAKSFLEKQAKLGP